MKQLQENNQPLLLFDILKRGKLGGILLKENVKISQIIFF